MAGCLFHSGASTETPRSALRPEIDAALVAAIPEYADPHDRSASRHAVPDEARQIFQRRNADRLDLVEKLMIERLAQFIEPAIEQAEIHHHAGHRVGDSADGDFGPEGMAVDFLARFAERGMGQRMRGL